MVYVNNILYTSSQGRICSPFSIILLVKAREVGVIGGVRMAVIGLERALEDNKAQILFPGSPLGFLGCQLICQSHGLLIGRMELMTGPESI